MNSFKYHPVLRTKSLAAPLNQLHWILVERRGGLHSWIYRGNFYKRHCGEEVDTEDVAIGGLSNAHKSFYLLQLSFLMDEAKWTLYSTSEYKANFLYDVLRYHFLYLQIYIHIVQLEPMSRSFRGV